MKHIVLLGVFIILTAFTGGGSHKVALFLIGDSTMANKPYTGSNPEKGWGQVLSLYFDEQVKVSNHALNGRSAKSFRGEGHWEVVHGRLNPGDYVLMQFGHNDQKENNPRGYADAGVEFPALLAEYIAEVRAKGAIPILATPIVRRKFDDRGYLLDTHGEYPEAVRNLAQREQVTLLELHDRSKDLLLEFGPERSKRLFMHLLPGEYERFPDGILDDTHLSGTGAFKICDIAVDEMKRKIPALSGYFNQ